MINTRRIASAAGQYLRRRVISLERALMRMSGRVTKREIVDGFIVQVKRTSLGTIADVIDPPAALTAIFPWGPDATLISRYWDTTPLALVTADRSSYLPAASAPQEPWRPSVNTIRAYNLFAKGAGVASGNIAFRLGQLKFNGTYAVVSALEVGDYPLENMGGGLENNGGNALLYVLPPTVANLNLTVMPSSLPVVYSPSGAEPSDAPAMPDQALSLIVPESRVPDVAPGYYFLPRQADKMPTYFSVFGEVQFQTPVAGRPDCDGRFGLDGAAGFTDELLVAIPVVKQSTAVVGSETWYDVFGEWGIYLCLGRMDRRAFDPFDEDTWMAPARDAFFDTDALPANLQAAAPAQNLLSPHVYPVHTYNLVRQLQVSRYDGGYGLVFQRTAAVANQTSGDVRINTPSQALVALHAAVDDAGDIDLSQFEVYLYDEDQDRGHAPAGADQDAFCNTTPVASVTVDGVAYFLCWRQWFARMDPAAEPPVVYRDPTGEGNFVLIRMDANGSSLVDLDIGLGAWQCAPRWQIGQVGPTPSVPVQDIRVYADISPYLTTETSGHAGPGVSNRGDDGAVKDRLDQIGQRKLCWLSLPHAEMVVPELTPLHHRLVTYDLDTGAIEVRGEVFVDGLDNGMKFGKVTVVTQEVENDAGEIIRPAVLLCAVNNTNSQFTEATVYLSTDGGYVWQVLAEDFTGRSGVFYAGNQLKAHRHGDGVSYQQKVL